MGSEKGKVFNNLTADFNNLETSKANNTKVVVDAVGNTGLKENVQWVGLRVPIPSFWAFETISQGEATHESCDLHNDIFIENQPHKKLPDADLWQVSSDAKLEAKVDDSWNGEKFGDLVSDKRCSHVDCSDQN